MYMEGMNRHLKMKKLLFILQVHRNYKTLELITINYKIVFITFLQKCNGILFNHESPRRGETFVTQKIVQGLCRIKKRKQKTLFLGNLYAKRDWGHARDYVEAMWLMLQQKKPMDLVISISISTKKFCK